MKQFLAVVAVSAGTLLAGVTSHASAWTDWLQGRPKDESTLNRYAIGGATSVDAASERPVWSLNAKTLLMTAVVRTNDAALKVEAEVGENLLDWSTDGVTRTPAASQIGVPEGCQRQEFSVDRTRGSTQLFLRLRAASRELDIERAPRVTDPVIGVPFIGNNIGTGAGYVSGGSIRGKHADKPLSSWVPLGLPTLTGPKGAVRPRLPVPPPDSSILPPAPPTVFSPRGEPLLGTYAGTFKNIDLKPRLYFWQYNRLKKWLYGAISSKGLLAGFAVVDVGYGTTAFVYVVDLEKGVPLVSRGQIGLPLVSTVVNGNPGAGACATFAKGLGGGLSLSITRGTDSDPFRVEIVSKDDNLRIDATLDPSGAPLPVASVVPTPPGDINATVKWNLLPVTGSIQLGSREWNLGDGFRGGFDYTQGILPSHTVWNWAFLQGTADDGTPIGLNLTGGIFPDGRTGDNALWAGSELSTLSKPVFSFDRQNYMAPWEVTTSDGRIQLRFTPKGSHSENRNLGLVNSRFIQVAGLFTGTVRTADGRLLTLTDVPGVMEDQDVEW